MQKTKSKAAKFLKLDRLGRRIAHAVRAMSKERKERVTRSFERSLLKLS